MGIESKPIDARALWERIGDVVGKDELCMDILYEELKAAPALPVVPVVHARWINIDTNDPWETYKCSNCGEIVFVGTDPYCQRCGAKMDLK